MDLKARGRTVFLTTHDMATADELCDRVAFVVDGRIVALDTPAELKIARSERLVRVEYRGEDGGLRPPIFRWTAWPTIRRSTRCCATHHVETIHSREASLDDVFVETTGTAAVMTRLTSALRLELTLQVRQKFLHAAIFSGLIWLAVLLPLSHGLRPIAEPYVLLGDTCIIGFFFIAGTVFFEKQERTLGAVISHTTCGSGSIFRETSSCSC